MLLPNSQKGARMYSGLTPEDPTCGREPGDPRSAVCSPPQTPLPPPPPPPTHPRCRSSVARSGAGQGRPLRRAPAVPDEGALVRGGCCVCLCFRLVPDPALRGTAVGQGAAAARREWRQESRAGSHLAARARGAGRTHRPVGSAAATGSHRQKKKQSKKGGAGGTPGHDHPSVSLWGFGASLIFHCQLELVRIMSTERK